MSWCRRPHRCLATVANAAMSARSASGEANPQRAAARRRICSCCRVYQAGSVADGLLHIRAGTCAGSGCVDFQQPVRSRVAGGGGVAAMSKPCARILTPTCGAYVARVVWVLCLFCLSCRCLPLHRAPLVFFVNRDGVASSSEAPRRLCAEVRQGQDLA